MRGGRPKPHRPEPLDRVAKRRLLLLERRAGREHRAVVVDTVRPDLEPPRAQVVDDPHVDRVPVADEVERRPEASLLFEVSQLGCQPQALGGLDVVGEDQSRGLRVGPEPAERKRDPTRPAQDARDVEAQELMDTLLKWPGRELGVPCQRASIRRARSCAPRGTNRFTR